MVKNWRLSSQPTCLVYLPIYLSRFCDREIRLVGLRRRRNVFGLSSWLYQVYVLFYLSRYLNQETVKGPFRSSSPAATCYLSNNLKEISVLRFAQRYKPLFLLYLLHHRTRKLPVKNNTW